MWSVLTADRGGDDAEYLSSVVDNASCTADVGGLLEEGIVTISEVEIPSLTCVAVRGKVLSEEGMIFAVVCFTGLIVCADIS